MIYFDRIEVVNYLIPSAGTLTRPKTSNTEIILD